MAEGPIIVRTRKFMRNPLLRRNQVVVDILHPSFPKPSLSTLRTALSTLHCVPTRKISVFNLRQHPGGGKSTAFALLYDSHVALLKFEPYYRLVRLGDAAKIIKPIRQHRSHWKNWAKRFRGRERGYFMGKSRMKNYGKVGESRS